MILRRASLTSPALFAAVAALTTLAAVACSSSHPVQQGNGGSGGSGGSVPEGDAGSPDADAATVDAHADGGCSLDLAPDASACDTCKADKCCNTVSADEQKPGPWTDSAAEVCAENQCATECGLMAPMCGGITPSPASCLAAVDAMCCDLIAACGESDACIAVIYLCIDDQNNDPGSAAFDKCAAQYPGGLAIFNPVNDCFSNVSCP